MNWVLKVSVTNFNDWKKEFDSHKERAAMCDENKNNPRENQWYELYGNTILGGYGGHAAINELRLSKKVDRRIRGS